jgi:uncharacterized membrane protein YbhN (UPF0104 family)
VNKSLTSSDKKSRIIRWLGTICSIILLIYLFQRQGWQEILTAFRQVSWLNFILGLLLIFVSRLAVVGRWHSLLRSVDKVSLNQSAKITFAGLFASNFLPTTIGGDVVRFAGAAQLKIDRIAGAASLVVDRLVGMFGMALVLPFGAKPLIHWLSLGRNPQAILDYGMSFSLISRFWERSASIFRKLLDSVKIWSAHPKSLLISFGFTLVHMLCTFGTIMLFFTAMGEDLSFGLIAGLWSFVYFVTLLPISINGYGVQEISIAFIFSEVGGASLESGLTVSVIYRTLMMIASLPGVLFVPGIIAGNKKQEEIES